MFRGANGAIVGVGIDLVDVREIEASIARFGDRYLARLYTPAELDYAREGDLPRRLGARFAAKEATIKALGEDLDAAIDWRAIEVVREPSGQPRLALFGWAAHAAARLRVGELSLSLTHEGHLAAAVVIATRRAAPSRLSWGLSKPRRNRD